MKAKLKYPIFKFSPDENMVYIFWEKNQTTQLAILKEADGWKGEIVIDSTGTKYTVKRSYMTGWKGIHGFTGMNMGMIRYETEYEDFTEPFSLRELQERIAERYPKTRWFKEECWNSVKDFRQTIFACKSFEKLAEVMMPRPLTMRTRIVKWLHPNPREKRMRIKVLIFLIIYLTICYLIFGWQR